MLNIDPLNHFKTISPEHLRDAIGPLAGWALIASAETSMDMFKQSMAAQSGSELSSITGSVRSDYVLHLGDTDIYPMGMLDMLGFKVLFYAFGHIAWQLNDSEWSISKVS